MRPARENAAGSRYCSALRRAFSWLADSLGGGGGGGGPIGPKAADFSALSPPKSSTCRFGLTISHPLSRRSAHRAARGASSRGSEHHLLGCGNLNHRAAAAAPHRLGRREDAAVVKELDPGRGADLASVDEVMSARLERRTVRA